MKWSKARPSVFKSEFNSSFAKLKDNINIKSSDIKTQLDEIENNTKKQLQKKLMRA